jgi:hypothetical protein
MTTPIDLTVPKSTPELDAYRQYIEDNLERIERGGWTPVCFDEFRVSEECDNYISGSALTPRQIRNMFPAHLLAILPNLNTPTVKCVAACAMVEADEMNSNHRLRDAWWEVEEFAGSLLIARQALTADDLGRE